MKIRTNLKIGAVAALGLNLLTGSLFSQLDNFPETQATLTLDIPGAGQQTVELSGPTQVLRLPISDGDQDGLEDIALLVGAMDLQGVSPLIGPVQLTLAQDPESGGFAEEGINLVGGQLEPPINSQLDMFVRISLPNLGRVLVNREPITLLADLTEVPPAPGEAYQFDGQVQLVDEATGELVAILTQVIHIVRPGVVEHDIFPETTASLLVELPATATPGVVTPVPVLPPVGSVYLSPDGAQVKFVAPNTDVTLERVLHRPQAFPPPEIEAVGPDELATFQSSMQGRATVNGEVFELDLSGPVQVITRGKAGQTTGSWETEMVSMSLSGNIPGGPPIIIREAPQQPSPGQTTVTDLGDGQFRIDSFFDVWTEISFDGGRIWAPSDTSLRVTASESGVDTSNPELPPDKGCFRTAAGFRVEFPGAAAPLVFEDVRNKSIEVLSRRLLGNDEVVTFEASLTATALLGGGQRQPVGLKGQVETIVFDKAGRTTGGFQTEILSMDLSGDIGGIPVQIRNSPETPSLGRTEISDLGNGQFHIDSFFDVWTELSVDGGPFLPAVQVVRGDLEEPTQVDIPLKGPAQVDVFFEGPNEGDARDDDNNGLDEVQTEIVSMSLTGQTPLGPIAVGLNPQQPSRGVIEEQVNNTPGLLDIDPFAPGDADSFFDVFFEIDLGGRILVPGTGVTRLTAIILDKPPRSGESYVFEPPAPVELIDPLTGRGSGIFIVREVHTPSPPVEVDVFNFTLGEIELISPDGGSEVITVDGPATVHVFFEGSQEGDAVDDDNDGRDEVETEMVALSLTGNSSLGPVEVRLNPALPSTGEIEELVNNTPGRLDLDPFHPGDADSFFDVFFEIVITTPAGPLVFHTERPKHMTAVITDKPPGPGNVYEGVETIELFDAAGNPTGFSIGASRHTPDPPVEVDVFDFTLGEIEIISPDGGSEVVNVDGPATVHVFFEGTAEGDADDDDGDGRDEVHARMVDLSLTGNSSLGPIEVRLNPALPSTGEIEELVNNTPGLLDLDPFAPGDADSFFDVFFEIVITTPAGPLVLHTERPKRMSTVITEKPPGPGNVYEGLDVIPLFDAAGNPTGFSIGASRHVPQPPCPLEIKEFFYDERTGAATIVWTSKPGKSYTVQASGDLINWTDIAIGIVAEGDCTTFIDQVQPGELMHCFYRVSQP